MKNPIKVNQAESRDGQVWHGAAWQWQGLLTAAIVSMSSAVFAARIDVEQVAVLPRSLEGTFTVQINVSGLLSGESGETVTNDVLVRDSLCVRIESSGKCVPIKQETQEARLEAESQGVFIEDANVVRGELGADSTGNTRHEFILTFREFDNGRLKTAIGEDSTLRIKVDYRASRDKEPIVKDQPFDLKVNNSIPNLAPEDLAAFPSHRSVRAQIAKKDKIQHVVGTERKLEDQKAPAVTVVAIRLGAAAATGVTLPSRKFTPDKSTDDEAEGCQFLIEKFPVADGGGFAPEASKVDCVVCAADNYISALGNQGADIRVITIAAGATISRITGLLNGEPYAIFSFYEQGLTRSQCEVTTPRRNYSLLERNGENEAKATNVQCFIATAAYGNAEHPDVDAFRWFRGRLLMNSAGGRAFVRLYYAYGPRVAEIVSEYPPLRWSTRALLWVPAKAIQAWQWLEGAGG